MFLEIKWNSVSTIIELIYFSKSSLLLCNWNFSFFLFTVSTIISDSVFRIKSATPQTRKSYPIPYKLMIIEESKLISRAELCQKHGIGESVIRKWRKDETKMRESLDQGKVRFRMEAAGRGTTGCSKMSESNISVDQSQQQQIGFQIPPS